MIEHDLSLLGHVLLLKGARHLHGLHGGLLQSMDLWSACLDVDDLHAL